MLTLGERIVAKRIEVRQTSTPVLLANIRSRLRVARMREEPGMSKLDRTVIHIARAYVIAGKQELARRNGV